mgnify:CR=1 FL=1|tara:strand:- start:20013 stop:20411 length:399 start_codon:yes stop_codon:yes gene_type:complete
MKIDQTLVEKVTGLKEHLDTVNKYDDSYNTLGSMQILDVKVEPEQQAAAYILEQHRWNKDYTGGIEYAVKIGVFKEGKVQSSPTIVFRDMYDGRRDNWSRWYKKIEEFEVLEDKVKVKVASKEAKREFTFEY